ncbi:hypothetical protein RclHR1_13230004 [Rhizophagus clarus]|uniref:Uncharacterized protein n=1 Tax=Rhizophagus clarus TaxID=94130 RepID=A0A2Z6R1V7_9GLOM|nr:hypothetical protein RclHR1_13230004 [Rhizophagus clarus]
MPKSKSKKKEDIIWKINCDNPTPLAFYRFVKPTHHNHADRKYRNTLNLALVSNPKNRKLTEIRKKFDDGDYKQDWEIWMQEKRAVQVHRSIQETNSIIVGDKCEVGEDQDKEQSQINSDVVNYERSRKDNDVAVASKKKE